MVQIQVDVDDSEFVSMMGNFEDAMSSIGEGMQQMVTEIVLPDVMTRSATVWNVITGTYSQGWYDVPLSETTIAVVNETPYAAALEEGWTLRNGGFMPSPGVASQTVEERADDIQGALVNWLMGKLTR